VGTLGTDLRCSARRAPHLLPAWRLSADNARHYSQRLGLRIEVVIPSVCPLKTPVKNKKKSATFKMADGLHSVRSRSRGSVRSLDESAQPPRPADGLHSVRSRSRGSVRSLDESAQPRRLRSKSQPRVHAPSATAGVRGRGRSLGAGDVRPLTRRSCSRTPRGSRSPPRRDSPVAVERVYTYCVPALPFSATVRGMHQHRAGERA